MHARADAQRLQASHEAGAIDLQAIQRQHDLEHVPVGVREVLYGQLNAERLDIGSAHAGKVTAGQGSAACGHGFKLGELAQANRGIHVREVELAAHQVDFHAVKAGTHDAL